MKTHIFLLNEPLGEFSWKMSPDFHRQFISSFRMTTSFRYHSRCYLVFVLKNSQLNFRDCLIIQLSMFLLSDFLFSAATFVSYHLQTILSRTFLFYFAFSTFFFCRISFSILSSKLSFVKKFFWFFYFSLLSVSLSPTAQLEYHMYDALSTSFLNFFIFFNCIFNKADLPAVSGFL